MTGNITEDLSEIVRLVCDRSGFEFTPSRMVSIEPILKRSLKQAGLKHLVDYVQLLRDDSHALDDLIDQVMIGESYFFRDQHHFTLLKERWLPEIQRQREPGHLLKVWSAGCAGGEEPYSLAIVFEQLGLGNNVEIFASDISRVALTRAQSGVYNAWSLRGVDRRLIQQFFTQHGNEYRLDPRIRDRVVFHRENLRETLAGHLDLIFCRNVLIYFSRDSVREVGRGLYDSLNEGGWLVTGPSDPLLVDFAPFGLYDVDGVMVHKHPSRCTQAENVVGRALPAPMEHSPERDRIISALIDARLEDSPDDANESEESLPTAAALIQEIRALADQGRLLEAGDLISAGLIRFPINEELLFLNAIVLMGLGHAMEAAQVARRLIFLDDSLAMAYYVLATALWQDGDLAGAQNAYQNTVKICQRHIAQAKAPFSDDLTYGQLRLAAQSRLEPS